MKAGVTLMYLHRVIQRRCWESGLLSFLPPHSQPCKFMFQRPHSEHVLIITFTRCRGVPVILPYHGTTAIPTGWAAFDFAHYHQHAIAALEGPPYVYSVSIDAPVDDLIEVIKTAVATPIDRQYVSFHIFIDTLPVVDQTL